MNREALLRALSKTAWAYVLLFFDVTLGTLNLLPDWVCYLLLGQAIVLLADEVRDLPLLRPFCLLLGLWAGLEWVVTLFGGSLDGVPYLVDLVITAVGVYFHFQLLTGLAALATRYQPAGMALDHRLAVCRNVNALVLTARFLCASLLPTWWAVLTLTVVGFVVCLFLLYYLFALRNAIRRQGETETPPENLE
jgi:hypothetical protein